MPSYDIDELLRKHDWIYRVSFDIWNTLGEDTSQWNQAERVIIGCTQFNVVIGNGFSDFVGNVHPRHFFECLEGLRAVRDNVSSRTAELVVVVFAEYGVKATEEATWDHMFDLDENSDAELDARIREIDDKFIHQICDDKGPDSLREALTEYIHSHIHELRSRKA